MNWKSLKGNKEISIIKKSNILKMIKGRA